VSVGPAVNGTGARAARAVEAARQAGAVWARVDVGWRARLIGRAATLLAADADHIVDLLVSDGRRPPAEAWGAELVPTLDALRWLVAEAPGALQGRRLRGSTVQWYFRSTRHRLTWEPHGVVAVVTPSNGLLFLALPQIAAALLAGNAVVWKPAPAGTAIALAVAALFYRVGLPPALLLVVSGDAPAAAAIVAAGVDLLHFTGSAAAGLALYGQQAARGRPAILELSGRHTAVVLAPADVERVAAEILWAKHANDGRDCVAVQLLLVERAAEAALLGALARGFRDERRGARAAGERPRLAALVDDALAKGARLVAGEVGGAAIVADATPGMRVVDEEVAGPVLAVAAIDDVQDAIASINGAPGRLSASVWTDDRARARQLAARLAVGQVWINGALHPTAQPEVPLAGRGASGFGATRGLPGLMTMVEPKVVSQTPLRAGRRHLGGPSSAVVDLWRATIVLHFAAGLGTRAAAGGRMAWAMLRMASRRG
jgi:acyl-CoA reductase-like NAD-dependent aldehyde dehydrogenase